MSKFWNVIFLILPVLSSVLYAEEFKLDEKLAILVTTNYRSVVNQGTVNYDPAETRPEFSSYRLYLNSTKYLLGSEIRKDYNLVLFGTGLKYNVFKWLSASFMYESIVDDVDIGIFRPTFLIDTGGIDFSIYNGKKEFTSYITSFHLLKVLANYERNITDNFGVKVGFGGEKLIATIDPGGFGSNLKTNQMGTICSVGVDYQFTRIIGLKVDFEYESIEELKFQNFTQKFNPLSFDSALVFNF
jgi:hypothetical protein